MDDLISRAAAIAQIKENYCYWCDHIDLCQLCETQDCIATIEQQVPAVDAAPVVRCSECKFGKLCIDADGHRMIQCTNTNYPAANVETWPLELDWYCAGGERRDGDT